MFSLNRIFITTFAAENNGPMKKVLLIYTGGTIGMIQNPTTGALESFDFDQLLNHVPELRQLPVEIATRTFDPPIDSSDMDPSQWTKLVRIIADAYDAFDGFVVLHGTDTMAYTASALSFMLEGLAKPVILTGSQLPIGMLRTDGKENLITSIEIAAAAHSDGTPRVPEVCVYFHEKLMRGNRVTKSSADEFDAFDWQPMEHKNVIGLSAQLWSEVIRSFSQVEWQLYPKMFGLSERAWNNASPLSVAEYADLVYGTYLPMLAEQGSNFHLLQPGIHIENGIVLMNSIYPAGEIIYTLSFADGRTEQAAYSEPFALPADVQIIKAQWHYLGHQSNTTWQFME